MATRSVFKLLFTPLVGLLLPVAVGLVDFDTLAFLPRLFTFVFFVVVTHITYLGTLAIVTKLRTHKSICGNIFRKLVFLLLATASFGTGMALLSSGLWQLMMLGDLVFVPVMKAAAVAAVAASFLALIYEAVLLSAEIDLDSRVMQQLDHERQQAEASVLQNELDPHFLFNCLNTLSYLVRNDADKAYRFVHKLSNVFKYLLLNKQKSFVSLEEEMAYLDDYHFLLRVRFDEGIQIKAAVNGQAGETMLLPCTLQALVENAIKHNLFSEKEPLVISIVVEKEFITVSNPVRPRRYKASSTKTGLHNLQSRYKVVMNKAIHVQTTSNIFLVKIPFERKAAEAVLQ
jgi:sensor histidine kinase YesM